VQWPSTHASPGAHVSQSSPSLSLLVELTAVVTGSSVVSRPEVPSVPSPPPLSSNSGFVREHPTNSNAT
jgi:hypothetical protein